MYYDTIIIGGGASGLCTAIKSKKKDNTVLVIEHNQRVGKKILSTGNGKCNMTNIYCNPRDIDANNEGIYPYFPHENRHFSEKVIEAFDNEDALAWFEELGILSVEKNGYIYPLSEQAASVLDALRYGLEIRGIDVITNYQPISIRKEKEHFIIDDEYTSKNLVLACGGMAAPKSGSDGSGYEIARSFGHSVVAPGPALCGLRCKGSYYKELKGTRCDAVLRLLSDAEKGTVLSCKGNIQFNDYGVSGIPAMQLSSTAGRRLLNNERLTLQIEFIPEVGFEALTENIAQKLYSLAPSERGLVPSGWLLNGILPKKLISVVLKEIGLNYEKPLDQAFSAFIASKEYDNGRICAKKIDSPGTEQIFAARLSGVIKHFKTDITGTCGFDDAQTSAGGVDVSEIDPLTMMSKLVPGLFFTGEIMDIDGICGGYNLQWAWSTAHIVSNNLL